MANRISTAQSLHDKVISVAKDYLNQKDYNIYLNPNGQKNAGIGDNYPDIILTKKDTQNVAFIIEVETADSITLDEATNQWKKYATEINASFYLLVPTAYKNNAEHLCRQVGISARFATYQTDNYGNINNIKFE
jgi:hypothetical protein